jgi:hypothetical protein
MFQVVNGAGRDTVLAAKICLALSIRKTLQNFHDCGLSQLCSTVFVATAVSFMRNPIGLVAGRGGPSKIFFSIVAAIPVAMSRFIGLIRRISVEGAAYKAVDM